MTVTPLQRYLDCMAYAPSDRRPNHELGAWPQTRARWQAEAPEAVADFTWRWFWGEDALGLDPKTFIRVDYGFLPPYEQELLEETPEYEVWRDAKGRVRKALVAGTVNGGRMSMDQYLDFPLKTPDDWPDIKRRLIAAIPARYLDDPEAEASRWQARACPLVLGENCAANGFYWRARELMGTEALSYAWYDEPTLMHEVMAFLADFIIETSRPVLEHVNPEYFCFNEDMSMKTGPLLSPRTYATFIQPHLRRVVDVMKGMGVKHVAVDTDGDPTALVPLLMDAGVDILWPIERAAGISPQGLRAQFGRDLRLWGGVDKRVLTQGPAAIKAHLAEMIPLIKEGGFIPTIDHTVPPDVSWDDFWTYMEAKRALLSGRFEELV
jgi:uroporphyrinogen decarboxylase